MGALSNSEFELLAILVLRTCFPEYAINPVKSERPDWKDPNGICIEVTKAEECEYGERKAINNSILGKKEDDVPERNKSKTTYSLDENGRIKMLWLNEYGPNQCISNAITTTQTKLEKMKHYELSDRNCLFVFLKNTVDDKDIEYYMHLYNNLRNAYTINFSDVFLADVEMVAHLDIENQSISKREISQVQYDKFQRMAKRLNELTEWTGGQRLNEFLKELS